ncbi:MAG: hypothetical protein NTV04_17175, partial [Deltaproteobacteria bacterium]|nr:hypothetical protein [Deltaproteobacteria bacterium]
PGKIEFFPDYKGADIIKVSLFLLFEHYFKNEGWKRLKRCPVCEIWFVDDTPNISKKRCGGHCTWAWWSRPRRKEAGHGKPKAHKRGR